MLNYFVVCFKIKLVKETDLFIIFISMLNPIYSLKWEIIQSTRSTLYTIIKRYGMGLGMNNLFI